MFGKKSADEVVLVTEAARCGAPGQQQQPGSLDAARRQNNRTRVDAPLASVERFEAYTRGGAPVAVGFNLHRMRAQTGVDVRRVDDGLPIRAPEASSAELEDVRVDPVWRKRQASLVRRLPVVYAVRERAELTHGLGTCIIRIKLFASDRPPAPRDPCATAEINRVQRAASPVPDGGRAPETADSDLLEWKIWSPNDLAAQQSLSAQIAMQATPLNETDVQGSVGQLTRDRQAGCTGPDNTHVYTERRNLA